MSFGYRRRCHGHKSTAAGPYEEVLRRNKEEKQRAAVAAAKVAAFGCVHPHPPLWLLSSYLSLTFGLLPQVVDPIGEVEDGEDGGKNDARNDIDLLGP